MCASAFNALHGKLYCRNFIADLEYGNIASCSMDAALRVCLFCVMSCPLFVIISFCFPQMLSVIARCADLLQPLTAKWLEDDLYVLLCELVQC